MGEAGLRPYTPETSANDETAKMSTSRRTRKLAQADKEEIDRVVISQVGDHSAWGPPIHVRRPKAASFSVPGELAARAAFLARIHHETRVEKWVEKVASRAD